MNCSTARAQSEGRGDTTDTVVIIRAGEVWTNQTAWDYVAMSERRARVLLMESYVREGLDSLYLKEVKEVARVRRELDEVNRQWWRERVFGVLLILILWVK